MIPLYDSISARRLSVTNYGIIAACAAVFLIQFCAAGRDQQIIEDFGLMPIRVTSGNQAYVARLTPLTANSTDAIGSTPKPDLAPIVLTIEPSPVSPLATLVTSLFLHAGWLQLLINLWFLAIFGDNVEDRFGHVGYLCFYLLCGVFSGLLVLFMGSESVQITIGAAGAVAGVIGAYMVIFPSAQIVTLTPFGKMFRRIQVPAIYLVIVWIILQWALSRIGHFPLIEMTWWTHLGGLVSGIILAAVLRAFGWLQAGELHDPFAERGYY
ncbi:rhomboid family intramembrane serine protease [Planctopirus hydrillae]|uniref:Peptidase S54 rhomboid domain-containing protein n=1 Tax=Planctopirus hydrillae TaxID=1841610 RepID=A0A1C3EHQ7_9PLAN|nr:rhomboid family intramembrane serine protease [Planctopirus hydrillae]ODA32770.1 hypothetical protein A6X21_20785 [Planctopirus hydrillae]